MKTAVIQISAGPDKQKNVARALALAHKAVGNGARFVLLPELFHFRGPYRSLKFLHENVAERIPGDSTRPFLELARKSKVYILAGSVYEKTSPGKKVFNTAVLINDRGKIAARYRKTHLFDARIGNKTIRESKFFMKGKKAALANVDGFKTGLSICYDLRFPEFFRRYYRWKCHVLAVPSCFTKKTGTAHWEVLLRARAIENACYVLAPNQVGVDGRGVAAYGNSMIISPWGDVLARGSGTKEEIVCAELDMSAIEKSKKILPLP